MQRLRDRLSDDLRLRNFSLGTQECYLRRVQDFVAYFEGRPPGRLGVPEVRRYLLHLNDERRLQPATLYLHVASLRFFYRVTLGRPEVAKQIPYPKVPRKQPVILSGSDVELLLSRFSSPLYRTIGSVIYACGLRVLEACTLKPGDIDSRHGVIHIRRGKGDKGRDVMLGARLLASLREYWRVWRPQGEWLFPGRRSPKRHVRVKTFREALHRAGRAAGFKQAVTPHLLRHCFATHMLEMGSTHEEIQQLLGHSSLRSTGTYVQLRTARVARIKSPFEVLDKPEVELLR